MDKELITKIAKEIFNETILENWLFYSLVIAISIVGQVAGQFLASYFNKRAENLAIKSDLEAIQDQLKSNTEITEKISNDIKHQIWRKQQVETIKRDKLEEYLALIYRVQHDLSVEMKNTYLYENTPIDEHAMNKASMIQSLYFPELLHVHIAFKKVYARFRVWISEGMNE